MSFTITALMTAPRYECTTARNVIEQTLRQLGVPLAVSGGVYYDQAMQTMMEQACEAGVDYILTVDGDSIFTPHQVRALVERIESDASIDAIAPLQVRRGVGTVLATAKEQEQSFTSGPIAVETAHFGCTVIRASKLAQLPKPWFYSVPNDRGEWKTGKTDADIWFWQQWGSVGNSVVMDPSVRIGHLEEMVTFVDDSLNVRSIYVSDWLDRFGAEKDKIYTEAAG